MPSTRNAFLDRLLQLQGLEPQDYLSQLLAGVPQINPVPTAPDNQGELEELIIRRKKGGNKPSQNGSADNSAVRRF